MRNFIVGCLLAAAVIGGVGFYRGWFTVNETKIQQDEAAAKEKMNELDQQVKEKASDLKSAVKDHK